MLALEPSRRVTAQEHLNHPWLRGLPSDELNVHFQPNSAQPTLTPEELKMYGDREALARAQAAGEIPSHNMNNTRQSRQELAALPQKASGLGFERGLRMVQ